MNGEASESGLVLLVFHFRQFAGGNLFGIAHAQHGRKH